MGSQLLVFSKPRNQSKILVFIFKLDGVSKFRREKNANIFYLIPSISKHSLEHSLLSSTFISLPSLSIGLRLTSTVSSS
jgi:hypothetical protein